MRYLILAMAVSVAGCAGMSDIVPVGPDTYVVQTRRHGIAREGSGAIAVLKQANEYCAAQNRIMIQQSLDVSGNPALGFQVTRLTFACGAN
jgi:hypothetical protein